jgi:hypothetical protein
MGNNSKAKNLEKRKTLKEDQIQKVCSVMMPSKATPLADIVAASGFSQGDTLKILQKLAHRGLVKPVTVEGEEWWLRF